MGKEKHFNELSDYLKCKLKGYDPNEAYIINIKDCKFDDKGKIIGLKRCNQHVKERPIYKLK